MKKVMLITNVPTPYRVPLFERMNKAFRERGWELTVVFGDHRYNRRKYELEEKAFTFKHVFLTGGQKQDSTNPEATVFLYRGLMHQLRETYPDHVIVSGFSPATIRVWWWSLKHNKTFSIWSGTIPKRGSRFGFIRKLGRRWIATWANGFIAYGSDAREYLLDLGVPDSKIDIATNTVDTAFFREETALQRTLTRPDKDSRFTFTYIGYLVPRKRVNEILHAASELARQRNDFRIRIIGDGPERTALEELSNALMLNNLVEFQGHKQTSELPAILAGTDVFLFQTGFDIWGLVLNEAMAAGIACIASIHGGATTDLIQDGLNGFRLDFSNTDALIQRMNWCMEHPRLVQAMGLRAAEDVESIAGLDNAVHIFTNHTVKASGRNT